MNGNEAWGRIIHRGPQTGRLDAGRLLAEAVRMGAAATVDPEFEAALKTLVQACNEEAELSLIGALALRQHLRELLEARLQLLDLWRRQPEIVAPAVLPQIFITGLPKTGSTFLQRLLALDPDNRVPRMWEVMFPLPPPEPPGVATDPRVRKAENRLRWLRWSQPELVRAHPVGATIPQECGALMGYTLESSVFLDMLSVPSYESWLRGRSLLPAYRFHAQFLKHLQWRTPAQRWVLKSSDHLHALQALLTTYPDARFIFLHRDPLRVLQAACSQMALLKRLFSRGVNPERLGEYENRCLNEKIDLILEFRDRHPQLARRIVDLQYRELADDPVEAVRNIYESFGFTLSDDAAARMSAFAASERGSNHADTFALADFHIDPRQGSPHFDRYRERFKVAREDVREQ